MDTKVCSCCHKELPVSDYGSNRQTPDGLMYYCRACAASKQRSFRKTNPDSAKASKQKYLEKMRAKNDAERAKLTQ
jgi:hypothetical protein